MEQRLHAHDAAFDGAPDADDDEHPAPVVVLEDRRYDPGESVEQEQWTEFATAGVAAALEMLDTRSRDIITRRWLAEPKATLRELAEEYDSCANAAGA